MSEERYQIIAAEEGVCAYPALVDTIHLERLKIIYTSDDYQEAVGMKEKLNTEYEGQSLEKRVDLIKKDLG